MMKEIPGFYYDPDKKKYFRIQANHVAPVGSQYSREAVKRRKVEKQQRERKAVLGDRTAKERIKRASCLNHPLTRVQTEISEQHTPGFVMQAQLGKVYASQLRRRELYKFRRAGPENSIADFVRHPRSGVIVAGINQGVASGVTICPPSSRDSDNKWSYKPERGPIISVDQYRFSSISLSHTGYYLMTMDSGPQGDSCLVTRILPDPEIIGDNPLGSNLVSSANRIRDKGTLWCSSARPTGDRPFWAIGTSDGLHTLEGQQGEWTLSRTRMPYPEIPSGRSRERKRMLPDITTVEWLTPDVIVSGLRNSAILFHDLRSGGWVGRLQHAHSVSKIRKIDEYRLVAAGFKSLAMYDLRYPINGVQAIPRPNHAGHTSTKPYISFTEYNNELVHMIDVNRELGLLASCTDDHKLQLYSTADGSLVSSPASNYRHSHPISRIWFENSDYPVRNAHGPRLLASSGPVIEEWTW